MSLSGNPFHFASAKFLWMGVVALAAAMGASASRSAPGPPAYDDYAGLLEARVNSRGLVDYSGLKKNPGKLDAFLREMAQAEPSNAEWSDNDRIAFWINAYNAITLKVVIDHYPIRRSRILSLFYPHNSIRQIDGAWDEITHEVAGRALTLEAIEHEILRKEFDEPRIHVALVCAAMGCPPLRAEPYAGERLDAQLDDQARRYLRSAKGFRMSRQGQRVYLSKIFDWFAKDFIPRYGTDREFRGLDEADRAVMNFVSRRVSQDKQAYLRQGRYDIEYIDYDWSLNEQ